MPPRTIGAVAALLAGAAPYTPTHLRGVLTVAKAQLVEQQREELLDRQEGIGSLLEYGKPFAYYYRILEKQRRRAEAVTELLNDVSLVEREIDGLMERLEYGEDPEQILKHVEGDALLGRVLDEFSPATYARATEPVGARPYGATPAPLRGSARGNRRIRFESPRARRFLTPPHS
ncbi:hypothetical protein SO694_00013314 [Aureococcus anophagefferens]|uniref:Uncharacterized protein n=1 Tax=Aureococcus anophagefferens TaxID=44056 RepID=A0ABR1G1Q6_AURAN